MSSAIKQLVAGGPSGTFGRQHAFLHEISLQISRVAYAAALRVDDDGPGVSESERYTIFRRFRRGNVDYGGSGLGLALVQAIIVAYGGSVSVSRNAWGGAFFLVEIPLPKELSSRRHGHAIP